MFIYFESAHGPGFCYNSIYRVQSHTDQIRAPQKRWPEREDIISAILLSLLLCNSHEGAKTNRRATYCPAWLDGSLQSASWHAERCTYPLACRQHRHGCFSSQTNSQSSRICLGMGPILGPHFTYVIWCTHLLLATEHRKGGNDVLEKRVIPIPG